MPSHVIIGGGPAAINAAETIRQFEQGASRITMICDEPAHSRMALPYWIANKISRAQTHTGDANYFRELGVETRFGRRAAALDVAGRTVKLDDGNEIAFDRLLIATGSSPIQAKIPGADLAGVQPMWSLDHGQLALDRLAKIANPRVVLVGAGFIGFIIMNALRKRGCQLAVVERESQLLPRMLDGAAAEHVANWLDTKGIAVHAGETVQEIKAAADGSKQVVLASGTSLPADLVVLATGIRANTDLAQGAGLAVDRGILVDDRMATSVPGIYAAGDVAQGPVLFSNEKQVHAIQPTAVDHGRVAGANMAGHETHYAGSLLMNIVDADGLQAVSFGNWDDAGAEAMIIDNAHGRVYRKLLWTGDQITGAIFVGKADDVGMLTDVGMVKGILQTQTRFGPWKNHLAEYPYDIRRAYVATGVAQKLVATTLLGSASRARKYQSDPTAVPRPKSQSHAVFISTKGS